MPVTGSSLVLRWAIVQDGVTRRSDDEAVEVIRRGMSRVVVKAGGMFGEIRGGDPVWLGEDVVPY